MNKRKEARKIIKKKDAEWAKAVKAKDGSCVICKMEGRRITKRLNAHHIIPRQNPRFRWDVLNGISLCPRHHRFSFELSAHQNSFLFYNWLLVHRPEQFSYLISKLIEKGGNESQKTS